MTPGNGLRRLVSRGAEIRKNQWNAFSEGTRRPIISEGLPAK